MIYLTERVVSVWETEVARWYQPETGGMLLGYETVSGQLVVTEATRAGPQAKRRWGKFEPDDEWDKRVVAESYEASGRIIVYLGEWHSHSFGNLRPSGDDLQTMRLISSYEPARISRPVSAILVRRFTGGVRFVVYRLNRDGQVGSLPIRMLRPEVR